jgi:putative ABC transport system permease protein
VDATLHGVSAEMLGLGGLRVVEGRGFDQVDEQVHAQVCLIGQGVRRELFGYAPVLGKDLQVNDLWLEVVGVLGGSGGDRTIQGVTIGSTDQEIYVPVTTALRKLARNPLDAPLDEVVLKLDETMPPREAATLVAILLDRLHGGVQDFEIVVPDLLIEQSRRTQRLFSLVMGCIAGISLLVGGIGIMNIMLASVLERTREIGIRRAAGATRRDIGGLFLIEGLLISLLGGLAGIAVGTAIARVVAASAQWPTVITPLSVILSFSVAVAVGLLSGIYPALRAADLDPIDALRYE